MITHVAIGVAISGANEILYFGPLTTPLVVNTGVIPEFISGALTFTES